MNLGKNIKELRIRKGLTQKDLAEKLNVTPQAVSRWELDTVEPSLDTIKEMTVLFDITLDQLLSENLVESLKVEEKEEEVVKPEVVSEKPPVIGVCYKCGNLVRAGQGTEYKDRSGRISYLCDDCEKKLRIEKRQALINTHRLRRNRAYWLSGSLSFVMLVVALLIGIFANRDQGAGAITGAVFIALLLTLITFTTTWCITYDNNIVGSVWEAIVGFTCVKFPGIIFSLSIDGFIFLFLVKILFWIIDAVLILCGVVLATSICSALSLFVFPFAVRDAYKRPEKYHD